MEFKHVIGDLTNHAYLMKPQIKTLDVEAQGSALAGGHIHVPGRWCTLTPWDQKLRHSGPSQTMPMGLSSGCSSTSFTIAWARQVQSS